MATPGGVVGTEYLNSPRKFSKGGVKPLIGKGVGDAGATGPAAIVPAKDPAVLPSPGRTCHIGTAGWNVPSEYGAEFGAVGTHLARYASRLNAVEINSSFYRSHRHQTYQRWADCVPEHFRFAVKVPKEITHECALHESEQHLDRFAAEVAGLDANLGVLLVQLPPSLHFEEQCATQFFHALRARIDARVGIACEPRHRTWFTQQADSVLSAHEIARVAADPPRSPEDGTPGGWQGLHYYRLHGSPHMYYSNYDSGALERTHRDLAASTATSAWCIFDNTAARAALGNALALQTMRTAL